MAEPSHIKKKSYEDWCKTLQAWYEKAGYRQFEDYSLKAYNKYSHYYERDLRQSKRSNIPQRSFARLNNILVESKKSFEEWQVALKKWRDAMGFKNPGTYDEANYKLYCAAYANAIWRVKFGTGPEPSFGEMNGWDYDGS